MNHNPDSMAQKLSAPVPVSPTTPPSAVANSDATDLDRALVGVRDQLEQELTEGRDDLRHSAYLRGHRAAVAPWYRRQVAADIATLERRGAASVAGRLRCLHALDQIRQDPRDLSVKLQIAGLAGRFEQSWREAFGEQPSPLKATPHAYELATLRERPAPSRSVFAAPVERQSRDRYWETERERDRD